MPISSSSLAATAIFALAAISPLYAKGDGMPSGGEEKGTHAKEKVTVVLYEGPLAHDQDWTIKYGPPSADNYKIHPLGGTCSLISSDVSFISGFERITFEAERLDLGVWSMAWTDTVTGHATGGNRYTYRNRSEFTGITSDGRAPKPNRAAPSAGDDGFLQIVPSNVNTGDMEVSDFFLLYDNGGNQVANSHVHGYFRLQMPPAANDPPPAYFPFVLSGHYIARVIDRLSGQVGCDPL